MKLQLALATVAVALGAAVLSAAPPDPPSALQFTCVDGTNRNTGNCLAGRVTVTGTSYPHNVQITVTSSSGQVLDDAKYNAARGNLSFTESLFHGTYTIVASRPNGPSEIFYTLTITVE